MTKENLRKIKRMDDLINAKLEQVEQLKAMATKITVGISSGRVQTSNVNDQVASNVVKIVDLEAAINESVCKLVKLKHEAMEEIDRLQNEDYKLLLTLRYLNFKTWEEIGDEMNYSCSHIYRIHEKALEEIEG